MGMLIGVPDFLISVLTENKVAPAMFVIGRTFLTQQQQCREFFLALVCESPWWFT